VLPFDEEEVLNMLARPVAEAFKERFKHLTTPQLYAIPRIIEGKNILLMAPTGSGKCVSGDTLVLTEDGLEEISKLYGRLVRVNSLDDKLKISQKIGAVIRKRKSKLYLVVTRTGRYIKVTDDHRFLTIKNGSFEWVKLSELRIGDYIAVARRLEITDQKNIRITLKDIENVLDKVTIRIEPSLKEVLNLVENEKSVNVNELARKLGISKDSIRRALKGFRVKGSTVKKILEFAGVPTDQVNVVEIGTIGGKGIRIPEINEAFAYFIGLLLGDGNINNARVIRFSNSQTQLINFIKSYVENLNLSFERDKSRKYDYYFCSRPLVLLLQSLGFPLENKSAEARIPKIFFKNKSLLCRVLKGLFDTDGSISRYEIELTTKSRKLAIDILHALLCLDIFGFLREKKIGNRTYYRIVIDDADNRERFLKKIGFTDSNKQKRLYESLKVDSNPNLDIVSNINLFLKKWKESINKEKCPKNIYVLYRSYIYKPYKNPTRKGLSNIVDYLRNSASSTMLSVEFVNLEKLCGSDIFWDTIKEIREAGEDYVYDITVPETRNFIGNGIILHNTEAVLLPILSKMLVEVGGHGVKLLYITPLRALNRDLLDRIDWWAQRFDLRVAVRHGDTASRERRIQTISPPDILITTPETLQVILTAKILRNYLRDVKWVIVDEVHELATDKRGAQLSVALERLRLITGVDFQRIGLSATIGSPRKIAEYLVGVGRECEIIDASVTKSMEINVLYPTPTSEDYELAEKLGVFPDVAARLRTIRKLIEEHESTLIFTNTRPLAEILTNRFRLWDENVPVGIHHGSLSKSTRITAEQGLKSGELVGIICTSSLELGIDVGRIELCIQYNSPREVTRLVQRVGRSGHSIEKTAKGVVIVIDSDDALESIVITARARNEELEEAEIPLNPLDVLMHQVAGLTLEYNRIKIDDIMSIVKKSYNFKDLTIDYLKNVLQHMSTLGIIEVKDDVVVKPRRSMELYEYYFSNLSMIPEEHQYLVIEEKSGESVGVLDEEFVAEYGEPGTRFILMGRAWEILHTEGDKIYVSSLEDYEGAVPSWVGDEIPVPFEIAQEVGALRREYAERRILGEEPEKIINDIAERYRVGFDVVYKAFREVEEHLLEKIPVPSDKTILLEVSEPYVVLHIHGGLKANRTIQKVLSYYISEKIGAPIHGQQNPYRVVLRSKHLTGEIVMEAINELVTGDFEEKVRKAVESSTLFKRRLIHVARKMGVIKSEASITDLNLNQFAETLKDTVVYQEALNYTLFHDFDIETSKKLLEQIVKGVVEVKVWRSISSKPSPLAKLTLSRFEHEGEVTATEGLKKLVLSSVKTRLMYESWIQVCTECFEYYSKILVKDMDEKPKCPVCGSDRIGLARCELEDILGLIARKGRPINRKERKILAELRRNSVLIQKYGRPAAIVLSARGLSLKEVVNILKQEDKESLKLIELIIEAEKKALQKRFQ